MTFALAAASALGVWAGKFALNDDVLTWVHSPSPRARSSELPHHTQAG
jgi:hypothetical protein